VLAYTNNFKRQVVNLEISKYRRGIPTIPQELKFRETNVKGVRAFHLSDGGKIGRMQLIPFKKGFKIKSILIDEQFKGQGYGKALYVYTIRKLMSEGKTFYSDQGRTEEAERVWNSLNNMGITSENNRVVTPYPANTFDKNGEVKAEKVIEFAREQNEITEPLSFVEQQQVRIAMSEFPNLQDSVQLTQKMQEAFYSKDGLFSPTQKSLTLSGMYSKYEINKVLSDVIILGNIKETVEKLKRTELIYNTKTTANPTKTGEFNLLGKVGIENSDIVKQDLIQELGGTVDPDLSEVQDKTITQEYLQEFKRVPVINENGEVLVEEVIYAGTVKLVDKPEVFRAIDAIESAPEIVDTTNLQNKLSKWLLDFGINIQGFTRELLPSLREMLQSPSNENVAAFSEVYREVFNAPVKTKEKVIKIDKKERDLVFLETNRTEQELFDDLNLLKTETPNIYHVIEKVDFEQMIESLKLDPNISELQAYKDYFNYNEVQSVPSKEFNPVILQNDVNYLTKEFITDFNIEKLKNPESGFYNKFEITEKGIELKYADPISMAEIQAHLKDGVKLGEQIAEYSLISKQMPNLAQQTARNLGTKFEKRVDAVNNFEKVKKAKGVFSKVNQDILIAKNETAEFLRNGEDLFELQTKEGNMSVFGKIARNEDLNYNEMNPQGVEPLTQKLILNISKLDSYVEIKKNWNNADLGENFDCQ
jgi:hypothetical protein